MSQVQNFESATIIRYNHQKEVNVYVIFSRQLHFGSFKRLKGLNSTKQLFNLFIATARGGPK